MNAARHLLQIAIKTVAACAMLAGASVTLEAKADVWVHVDAQGVAHFAPERLDERYEIFYRGPTAAAPVPSDAPVEQVAVPLPTLKDLKPRLAQFFASSPRYKQIQSFIQEAARIHRVDYELLQALIAAESGFEPEAISNKGAIGLMQVMPDTARRLGVDSDRWSSVETKLKNPRLNLQLGARYLRMLIDMFPGRLDLALASYNAGEGAVQKAGNAIPNFKETQDYVVMVTQLYRVLKPPPVVTDRGTAKPGPRYGSGFVLNTPREPYTLVPSGRGNMVQPIRNAAPSTSPSDSEYSVAVD
ncbi:MAG: lytic transglycosylase domain-containing protein [Burkholderiales bacterium]|nr:lytic transglycosylase domain-containing protein [Burkholderiales bacterium]